MKGIDKWIKRVKFELGNLPRDHPHEHQAGALSTKLRELRESKVI